MKKSILLIAVIVVLLTASTSGYAQTITLPPIAYGTNGTFSFDLSATLEGKIFQVSSVVSSCGCVKAVAERKSRGVYTVKGTIATVGFDKGYQEKKVFCRTNNWDKPVYTALIRYQVIDAAAVIPVDLSIPAGNDGEFIAFLSDMKRKYGDALEIKITPSSETVLFINGKKISDLQLGKIKLITELMALYPYLEK